MHNNQVSFKLVALDRRVQGDACCGILVRAADETVTVPAPFTATLGADAARRALEEVAAAVRAALPELFEEATADAIPCAAGHQMS